MISSFMRNEGKYSIEQVTEYLKNMANKVKGYGGTYVAGSLVITLPDLESEEYRAMVNITLEPISEVEPEEKEAYYYASIIYARAKGPTAAYQGVAQRNIEEFASVKRLSDFMEGKEMEPSGTGETN